MIKKYSKLKFLCLLLAVPVLATAGEKSINVIVNSANPQTQTMAMVLSMKSLQEKAQVNITLCSGAGDLANKNVVPAMIKKPDGKVSAKGILTKLIEKGANVEVCPLYLQNIGKDKTELMDGVKIANPEEVAKRLLDENIKNISF